MLLSICQQPLVEALVYTVKQVAELAEVSVRTLHYYDEIGLLHPSKVGTNGYRYYDDDALLRLQQILFYREIGLELLQIKAVLDQPDFDLLAALRAHRTVLQEKINRLKKLVGTVDTTMMHLTGEVDMSRRELFSAFSDEQQQQYEREARLQYDPQMVNDSLKRWRSYTASEQQAVRDEGNRIYADIVRAIEAGVPAESEAVQAILDRWQAHLRYYYEPTLDLLRGLGELYNSSPDFSASFQKLHPDLPAYLQTAITHYVDDLEYAEIARMLEADEAERSRT